MSKLLKSIFVLVILSLVEIVLAQGLSDNLQIHGFLSQGYMKSTNNNYLADTKDGTFQFNEIGINFSTNVSDKLRLGLQFFSRDLGLEGNDEITIDWAFADYKVKDWFGFRVGKLKMIGGNYNEIRDMDLLRTSALLPASVYPELYRDTFTSIKGTGIYGTISLNDLGSFLYNAQIGMIPMETDGGFSKAYQKNIQHFGTWTVDTFTANYAYTFGGKWETPLDGLNLGASYYSIDEMYIQGVIEDSPLPNFAPLVGYTYEYKVDDFIGYFLSTDYTWNNFYIIGEFTHTDIKGRVYSEVMGDIILVKSDAPVEGWYISGAYRFTDWFELGSYYSEYYPKAKDKEGKDNPDGLAFKNWLKEITLSFRFDVNSNWIFKLEYHRMDGFGAFSSAKNLNANLKKNWNLFVAKMTYNF